MWTFRDGRFCVQLCIETLCKRATSVAHLTNFSLEIFYALFTEDASLNLYHGEKKSKMTKNSNQGGPALKHALVHYKHREKEKKTRRPRDRQEKRRWKKTQVLSDVWPNGFRLPAAQGRSRSIACNVSWTTPTQTSGAQQGASLHAHFSNHTLWLAGVFRKIIFCEAFLNFRVLNSTVVCNEHSSPRQIFAFKLVPKSLWTLPSPVLWNRGRLDTFRKQVQCHQYFLFARMSPEWEYEARTHKRIERKHDVCLRRRLLAKWWGHSPSEVAGKQAGRGCNAGEVCSRRLLFSGCTWKEMLGRAPGVYTQCVCEVTIERYLSFKQLGFLERQSTVSSFSSQVVCQARDAPTWVSRIQMKPQRIALRTLTETHQSRDISRHQSTCVQTAKAWAKPEPC